MRVLHLISNLDIGGAESTLVLLANKLGEHGIESTVISLTNTGALGSVLEANGHRVFSLGLLRGRPSLRGLAVLRRHIVAESPDVVQSWMYHADLAGALVVPTIPGVALVWGVHGGELPMAAHPVLTRMTIRACALLSGIPSAIVYASRSSHAFHAQLGYRGRRTAVLHNGADLGRFSAPHSTRELWRAQHGLGARACVVGALSRFHPMKDHETMLSAFALALPLCREMMLLLAGRGMDPNNAALVKMIRDRSLESSVMLLGERRDVTAFLSACDVFVSSSFSESFPVSLVEALAVGLPIAATDAGDSAEIVGKYGRIVPVRDPAALASGILDLVRLSEQERATMSLAARASAQSRFAAEDFVERYVALYGVVCGRKVNSSSVAS